MCDLIIMIFHHFQPYGDSVSLRRFLRAAWRRPDLALSVYPPQVHRHPLPPPTSHDQRTGFTRNRPPERQERPQSAGTDEIVPRGAEISAATSTVVTINSPHRLPPPVNVIL